MPGIDQFSSLGTSVFISAVGISTGITMISYMNKRIYKSMIIGSGMVFFGFAIMKAVLCLDHNADYSTMVGIFCGAMTSTPGLSSACEAYNMSAEMVTFGYSCSYPIGVLTAVFAAQLLYKHSKNRDEVDINDMNSTISTNDFLPFICICIIAGKAIGLIHIPILDSSIGTSGGTLLVSIIIGALIGKRLNSAEFVSLDIYRSLGLSLFLAGNGINCGLMLTAPIDIKWIIYSLAISLLSASFGYIMCQIVWGAKNSKAAFVLAGGLTSTPAVGGLIRKTSSDNLPDYSAAYFGALVTMIALMSIAL